MKICILSPLHSCYDVRIFQKEALTLAQNGYDVTLVAQVTERTEIGDVRIEPAPKFGNRLQRFLTQPLILFKALKINADAYHIHNPDMLLIGYILKLFRKKVVYDTHEDFSKRILMREWIPLYLRKFVASIIIFLEKSGSKYFDATIVTQPQMLKKYGSKAYLIENAPIVHSELTEKAYRLSEDMESHDDVTRLIYVGGISKVRGIKETIEVLEELNKVKEFRLWLIGPCNDKSLIDEFKKMPGWAFVDYLEYLPQEEAFAHMINADIGLVTILDVGDHATTSPNKLFEYQRFRLPFLSSNFPKWVEQVSATNSGVFVEPKNIKEITNAILKMSKDSNLLKQMGENGQSYIFEKFNWSIESEKLLSLYDSIKQEEK